LELLGDRDGRFYGEGGRQGLEFEPITTKSGQVFFSPEGVKPKDFALITDFNPECG
jgi:hypothetical protein